MRTHRSRMSPSPIGALVLCLALLAPLAAAGQSREFTGEVARVGEKRLVVENRMGDKRHFHRTGSTRVEGRSGWKALKEGDRVIVSYERKGERYEISRVIVLGGGR